MEQQNEQVFSTSVDQRIMSHVQPSADSLVDQTDDAMIVSLDENMNHVMGF